MTADTGQADTRTIRYFVISALNVRVTDAQLRNHFTQQIVEIRAMSDVFE